MDYRNLLVSAVLAAGVVGLASVSRADIIAGDNGIAVEKSDVSTPARGMTMTQVASKFGTPTTKVPAVGKPPISRWEYPASWSISKHDHVIHSVVSDAALPSPASGSAAPAMDAPPAPAVEAAPAPEAAAPTN